MSTLLYTLVMTTTINENDKPIINALYKYQLSIHLNRKKTVTYIFELFYYNTKHDTMS